MRLVRASDADAYKAHARKAFVVSGVCVRVCVSPPTTCLSYARVELLTGSSLLECFLLASSLCAVMALSSGAMLASGASLLLALCALWSVAAWLPSRRPPAHQRTSEVRLCLGVGAWRLGY